LTTFSLTFDADSQLLQGKNASGLFKVLDEVLLKGFKLPERQLYNLELHGGKNIEKVSGTEGFVVRPVCNNNVCYIYMILTGDY